MVTWTLTLPVLTLTLILLTLIFILTLKSFTLTLIGLKLTAKQKDLANFCTVSRSSREIFGKSWS